MENRLFLWHCLVVEHFSWKNENTTRKLQSNNANAASL